MGTLNRRRTPLGSLAAPPASGDDDAGMRMGYSAQTLPRKYTTTTTTTTTSTTGDAAPVKPARSGRKEFRVSIICINTFNFIEN